MNAVLPDFVLEAMQACPKVTDIHFFWNGRDKLDAIVGSWRRWLAKLFEFDEVPKGHAHRFRDTFAVVLLLAGVPIERVSVLLGHQCMQFARAPLLTLGTRLPRAVGAGFEVRLGTGPCGATGNEGYTRGTRKNGRYN